MRKLKKVVMLTALMTFLSIGIIAQEKQQGKDVKSIGDWYSEYNYNHYGFNTYSSDAAAVNRSTELVLTGYKDGVGLTSIGIGKDHTKKEFYIKSYQTGYNYSDRTFLKYNQDSETITLIAGEEGVTAEELTLNEYGSSLKTINFKVGPSGATNSSTLAVNGSIAATDLVITLDGFSNKKSEEHVTKQWPDYVFKEDYKLNTLDHVSDYIKLYGHLPNIPSADEIEKQGINVGEMNVLLLEKIEELTLHLIEMDQKIKRLEK